LNVSKLLELAPAGPVYIAQGMATRSWSFAQHEMHGMDGSKLDMNDPNMQQKMQKCVQRMHEGKMMGGGMQGGQKQDGKMMGNSN
jgi:hypothetical protein